MATAGHAWPGKAPAAAAGPSMHRRMTLHLAPSTDRLLARLTLAAALAWAGAAARAQDGPALPAMNSYGQPPFSIAGPNGAGGLAATLVEQFNADARPRLRLYVENLPRRRLEMTLEQAGYAGAVLFLAPEFLPASVAHSGEWSAPVMVDENLIVSLRPLSLATLDGLSGLRFGGIAGHVYRTLAPLLEAGRIERDDAVDHVANLKKLCLGRVDFVVISRSELAGTAPLATCARPLRPQAFPSPQVIIRRVLVRLPGDGDTRLALDTLARVACSDRWLNALPAYGLSNVGCRRKA